MHFPILSTLIFLPILAAILLLVVNLKNSRGYYIYGLFISLLNLVLSCKLLFLFDKKIADFRRYPAFRAYLSKD